MSKYKLAGYPVKQTVHPRGTVMELFAKTTVTKLLWLTSQK
jgi:hypothetical protein